MRENDTNAFTDAEQTKLSGIEAGATVNAATGGTSGGIGTVADPLYGSVQFRGGTNTLLGDRYLSMILQIIDLVLIMVVQTRHCM